MPTRQANARDEYARLASDDGGRHARPVTWELPTMTVVTLYSKPDCHLCAEARAALIRVQSTLEFELSEFDITTDESLHRAYFERIPVVALGDEELFEYFVDEGALRERLEAIL
jgi:glutaredoxin